MSEVWGFNVGDKIVYECAVSSELLEGFKKLLSVENLLHHDDKFANDCGFEKKIIPGSLTSSIVIRYIGLTFGHGTVLYSHILYSHNMKYLEPLYPGDKITIEIKIVKIIRGELTILKTKVKSGRKTAAPGETKIIFRRSPL